MKLKPYPEYKDSGIQWIGKIPEGWEVKKIKFVAQVYSGIDKKEDEGRIPLYGANGIIGKCERPTFKKEKVIIGRVGSSGEINYAQGYYCVSDNALVVDNTKEALPRYLFYFLTIIDFSIDVTLNAQPLLTATNVKNKLLFLPPLPEQLQIVEYLDKKTSKINQTIEKDKKLIALLKEKRTALINHAVTKGLDPNVKMKDSEVEWIGEIPEEWKTGRLKNKILIKYGYSLSEFSRQDGHIDVFGSNGIIGKHNKSITKGETIIIGRKGSYGKLNFSEKPCYPIDTTYFIDKTCTKYNLKYLFYLLTQLKLDETSRDSAVPGLSREIVYNKTIPYIPLPEQTAIANYLDKSTAKIDKTIKLIEKKINLLEEYKKSLIHYVVTGKVDIRRLAV